MAKSVTLYTQPGCAPCHAAKEYLAAKGIEATIKDIRADQAALKELLALDAKATPVAVVDGQVVFGFDRARLDELLA